MKKTILTTLMATVMIVAFGQVSFDAGLKGGLNFASLEGETVEEMYENRTGYHAGAFLNFRVQKFGIQPEVMVSSQGTKVNTAIANYIDRMDYIVVPVMIKFYPVDFLTLQFGPQFGTLISQKRVNAGGTDIITAYKESDLSLATGIGVELPFGLNITGRYNIGIRNVNDDPDILSDLENQVFQVSVGFRMLEFGDKD